MSKATDRIWRPTLEFRFAAIVDPRSMGSVFHTHLQQKYVAKGVRPKWKTIRYEKMTKAKYLQTMLPEGARVAEDGDE